MRTANNNYTVENLVAKYRNYVKEHCPKHLAVYPVNDKIVEEEVPNETGAIEALLLSLYVCSAGTSANKYVLKALNAYADLYKQYYKDALTKEEYTFLAKHFGEIMDYTLSSFHGLSSKPSRVKLIRDYISPEKGATIYLANCGYDVACLFPECKIEGFLDSEESIERWAIGQILLFSKGIEANIDVCVFYESMGYSVNMPQRGSVDYVVYGTHEDTTYNDILALYDCLSAKGKMLIFVDKRELQGNNKQYRALRKKLVEDRAISSIIAYRDVMPFMETETNNILLVVDKTGNSTVNVLSLCSNRQVSISPSTLNPDVLWPSYYLTTRPETGVPLSCLSKALSRKEDRLKFRELLGGKYQWEEGPNGERIVLPEWMLNLPIATASHLSDEYKDANLCNKELLRVADPSLDHFRGRVRIVNHPCVLIAREYNNSRKLLVGFFDQRTESEYARVEGMPCLLPNDGVDVRYLAALLLMPVVRDQILSIYDEDHLFGSDFDLILDWVMVPNHNEKERLSFLVEVCEQALVAAKDEAKRQYDEKLLSMKTEYINEVRMRKHDMAQYIFELDNLEDLMRYYIEHRDTEKDFCHEIEGLLDNFRSSLKELSELLNNLSREEQFGEPEIFKLDDFLSHLSSRHKADGFKIEYVRDESSIIRYNRKTYIDDALIDAMIDAEIQAHEEEMAIQDAMIDAEIQAHEEEMAMQDDIAEEMIEAEIHAHEEEIAFQDAMIDAEIQAHEEEMAIQDAMIDAEIQAHEEEMAMQDDIAEALIKAEIQAHEEEIAFQDAMIDAEIQAHEEEMAMQDAIAEVMIDSQIEDSLVFEDFSPYCEETEYIDGIDIDCDESANIDDFVQNCDDLSVFVGNTRIPSSYIAPNDIQRAVNNILDNARKHGFTDSNRKDYEIIVSLSIDVEKDMFQIDFRNNGNPLPEGMNKMRYGIKGEKAGKNAGTGLGGNYVKSFVEHYGGDYDIFMEDGWTVIRIYLPIK